MVVTFASGACAPLDPAVFWLLLFRTLLIEVVGLLELDLSTVDGGSSSSEHSTLDIEKLSFNE